MSLLFNISIPAQNFLELVQACASLYELVQAEKAEKDEKSPSDLDSAAS
jgi:hypothetical protein